MNFTRPVNKVRFDQNPTRIGGAWALLAVHGLSGQQEDVVGFHCPEEAIEWLARTAVRPGSEHEATDVDSMPMPRAVLETCGQLNFGVCRALANLRHTLQR